MAAFEVLVQVGWGMQIDPAAAADTRNQHMLLVRHAVVLVVDHLAVAIEREAVLGVAANAKNGNGLIGGHLAGDLIGERAGGVGAVEQLDDALAGADLGNPEKRADTIKEWATPKPLTTMRMSSAAPKAASTAAASA